ncbi:MAG: transferrin-binding protein-like solute binding protein [Burkholderiaceae bacterium]|nr:transferrin-binding protein-like solute binding protein [Burkholderiaceae bacterium]MCD8516991.1 transferrin-binding protein-like solute binding protein [Burkholderiaceae bacterium]MCD8537671.1 transferrin-binding protein-like solute binding protein [Burkholderiaceae bacterium]
MQANTEIVAPGISTETTFTEDLSETITSVGEFSSYSGIEFRETFGADRSVTKASITTGDGGRLIFDKADGAQFTQVSQGYATAAINKDQTAVALVVEPIEQGWSYQTFGVWVRSPAQGNPGRIGAASVGNMSPTASVPMTGVGVFNGKATGIRTDSFGVSIEFTSADMRMSVDFGSRAASFQTRNTLASSDLTRWYKNSLLDMNGTLQIVPGSNNLVGTATVPGLTIGGVESTRMSGNINAKFYGPSAQEIGGTFGLKGSGVETYIGGFGGKR